MSSPEIYECESGWNWGPHQLTDFDFWCVLAGKGQLTWNGKRHEVHGGDCFLLRAGDHIQATHNREHPLRVFAFHFEVEADLRARLEHAPSHKSFTCWDQIELYARQAVLWSSGTQQKMRGYLGALECLFWFLDASSGSQGGLEEALQTAARQIRSAPGRIGSVQELSRRAGVSLEHFSRAFKKQYGMSPKQYQLQARMARAEILLMESRMTLDQIAEAVGYRDGFQFSRQFSRHAGLPPRKFRNAKAPNS